MELTRVDPSDPGITRKGRGRGFEYFAPSGDKITDPEVLDRLRSLAIPPAWADVWICVDPDGHLQATGTDAAGRRQYRYHDHWRERRDAEKFDHMLDFARLLPDLRAHCVEVLEVGDDLGRERVLACAVRLLDLGFFRIGTERATDEDDSVGLTTMRKDAVTIRGGDTVQFDWTAKGGKQRARSLVDPSVVEVVGRLRRRRGGGEELLAFKRSGRWVDVTATDVNDLIKEHCGGDSSAKDFRTWNATVLAAVALGATGVPDSNAARQRAEKRVCAEVAHHLGNTPAVARSSYIDPRVFDRFHDGATIDVLRAADGGVAYGTPAYQGVLEADVLDLLTEDLDADGIVASGQIVTALAVAAEQEAG